MGNNKGGGDSGSNSIKEAAEHVSHLDDLGNWEVGDLVDRAEGVGKQLVKGKQHERVSARQIRNFLDEVNSIEMEFKRNNFDKSRVILLKPLLAYSAGRETGVVKQKLSDFAELFSNAADKVHREDDFKRFVQFTRAVVAYHRFYGGSNK